MVYLRTFSQVGVVFAFGQTGSGKTHTMNGADRRTQPPSFSRAMTSRSTLSAVTGRGAQV